jgi:hypothetical protein
MYRLGHATPDMAMRYQRATTARDETIARDLNELLRQREHPQAVSRSRREKGSAGLEQEPLPGL